MNDPRRLTSGDAPGALPVINLQDSAQREVSCATCKKIGDAIVEWPVSQFDSVPLSDWQGFLDRQGCKTCQQIVHYFKVNNYTEDTSIGVFPPSWPVTLHKASDGTFEIRCVRIFQIT